MSEKLEIYKCPTCGNIVQVLLSGNGELVCCGQAMVKLPQQFEENELGEKHIPDIVTAWDGCDSGMCNERKFVILDKHPMSPEHFIQFIEVIKKDESEIRLKFFNPEDKAEYEISDIRGDVKALEYCNIHNLWRSNNA